VWKIGQNVIGVQVHTGRKDTDASLVFETMCMDKRMGERETWAEKYRGNIFFLYLSSDNRAKAEVQKYVVHSPKGIFQKIFALTVHEIPGFNEAPPWWDHH
jgi:hypothetical protein